MFKNCYHIAEMAEVKRQRTNTSSYELFMAGLSVLAIINILLSRIYSDSTYVIGVIAIMNIPISLFFFGDFLRRMSIADSKTKYFFRDYGWADLLASLPFQGVKLLRLFRIIKAYRIISGIGLRNISKQVKQDWATTALYTIIFVIMLLLEYASIAVLEIEGSNPAGNIKNASDAIWWVYVTIATVGYGDKYPVTNGGRIVGIIVMFVGVSLFGVITGFLANKFLPKSNH